MEVSVSSLEKFYRYKEIEQNTIAIVDQCGNRKTTYKEFVTLVNSIAYYLKSRNIQVGDVVAIELGRTMEHYAFRLACHFIGAVFLDMNVDTPKKRKKFIYDECKPKIIINEKILPELVIKDYECQINKELKDTDFGYIIYTSGTTGTPKGILHDRSIYSLYENYFKYITKPNYDNIEEKTNISASLSDFTFIVSLIDMQLLFKKGSIHIIDGHIVKDVFKLKQYIIEHKIQSLLTVPSLVKAILPIDSLIYACVIGEKSNYDFRKYSTDIYNVYGASECPVMSFAPYGENIIGEKYGNTSVMLRDIYSKELIFEGENKTGEIVFCGPWIMSEYINSPELTKEAISYHNGKKLFHTKDIGRYTKDNHIQILGRMDSMVKVRGMRVHFSEIEYRLCQIRNIDEVAIKAFSEDDETYICAYYSTCDKKPISTADLQKELSITLNSYMIPAFFTFVKEFKRNEHGKLDRNALVNPKEFSATGKKDTKNIDDTVLFVIKQFEKILNCSNVGVEDDFITIGGNSLSSMKLQTKLSEKYDIPISSAEILAMSTPKQIAEHINKRLNSKGIISLNDLKKYSFYDIVSLSESQLNVYLDEISHNKQTAYNNPIKLTFTNYGKQDIINAVQQLIQQHPILKARIVKNSNTPSLKFDARVDVKILQNPSKFVKPFELEKNLSKFSIVEKSKEIDLYIDVHHIITDGRTMQILVEHLMQNLQKQNENIFVDTGILEDIEFGERLKEHVRYKNAKLFFDKMLCESDDVDDLIESVNNDKAGVIIDKLPVNIDCLNKFLQKRKITLNQYLVSVFSFTLSRFTGSDCALFCMVEDGRGNINLEEAAGMFVKTLPLLIDCKDTYISEYFDKTTEIINESIKYDFYPFRLLSKDYNVSSDIIFQYSHDIRNVMYEGVDFEELDHDLVNELSINIFNDKQNSLSIKVEHSKKYSDVLCRSIISVFKKVMIQFMSCKKLSDVNYTSKEDIQYLKALNTTEKELIYKDILQAFKESIEKYPDNKLVTYEDISYTYSEGAKVILAIAEKLREKDIQTRSNVAILVHRSHWYELCALGVLTNGCAYVPIDDSYPNERIAFMLKDTSVSAVLVTNETVERAKEIFKEYSIQTKLINVDKIDYSKVSDKYTYTQVDASNTACILYTSGTTGKPKGSLITRKAILNYSIFFTEAFKFSKNDIFAEYHSFGFDVHIENFYSSVLCGATVDIIPNDIRLNITLIEKYIKSHNITFLHLPAAVFKLYAKSDLSKLKALIVGGEVLGDIESPNKDILFDKYGPTEATVSATAIKVDNKTDNTSIGKFIDNTKGYILDSTYRQVPVGAVGELYLSGYQLASGYLNREEETKKAFLDNPFDGNKPGYEKMYKTGDMVRILPDGTIGFIGRKDSQVKIRGNRVELGEVETCIRQLDFVKDCTVVAISNNNAKELVSYVVLDKEIADKNKKDTTEEILKHISENKPSYMVPAFVEIIDKIPFNVNGKVDKRALPKVNTDKLKSTYVAPANENEKIIVEAFEKVLGQKNIGTEDDFIRLGGDSLSAIRAVSIIDNVNIGATEILSLKTAKHIAKHMDNTDLDLSDLDIVKIKDKCPLNEPQLNVYLDIKRNKKVDSYLIPSIIKIDDVYTKEDIKEALTNVLKAHNILSSCISEDENGIYLIQAKMPNIEYTDSITDEKLSKYLATPFSIEKSLSKFLIFKRENTFYLASVFHHLIFDGFSLFIFESEIKKALNKEKLKIDNTYLYSSAFTFKVKDESIYKDAEVFFESQLCDIDDIPTLIEDTDGTAGRYFQKLDANKDTVVKYLKENSISASAFMSCAFAYTVSRFTGSDKAIINIIENGRDRYKNSQSAIGMFVNTLPVAFDCQNKQISEFIKKETEKIYKTTSYNFYGFRLLAKKYNIDSSVMFQFDPEIMQNISKSDNDIKITKFEQSDTISDLSVNVIETKDAYKISITHSKKYSAKTVKAIVNTFNKVVNGILTFEKLSDINYISEEEISYLNKLNTTEKELKYKDILQAFKESIEKYPNNKLVKYEDTSYTYIEGAKVVLGIVDKLKENNVQARSNVAILVQRSHWYQLCALGVLTKGCAYVPIDDTYPDERIAFMLKDTSADAVLVTNETLDRAKEILKENSIQTKLINVDEINYSKGRGNYTYTQVDESDTACILYTSGTTGKPKGSLITRKALLNVCLNYVHQTKLFKLDIYSMHCSCAFDIHSVACFAPLIAGACVDIIPEKYRLDFKKLNDHFNKTGTTHTFISTQAGKIYSSMNLKSQLKVLLVGGEYLGPINNKNNFKLIDIYGPTESLVYISSIDVKNKLHSSSIGILGQNIKVYILDRENRLLPQGAVGELYISGYQLANGYLNREEETKKAFLDNPFDGNKPGYEKMYKTGDMVRILPDGTIGFIGRKDSQVKIRGNRVELGEIETCIRHLDFVKDCTVVAISNNNAKELVSYVVLDKEIADKNKKDTTEEILKHISENKPSYMVPAFVEIIDKIPLNVNGKVNKRALPKVNLDKLKSKYVAPANEREKKIVETFEKVLGQENIGTEDDFIRLGGDSLFAIRAASIIDNVNIGATEILSLKTAKHIAKHMDNTDLDLSDLDIVKIKDKCPLNEPQLNVYLDIKRNKKVDSYLIPWIIKIDKPYSKEDIKEALIIVLKCHNVLSSRILEDENSIYLSQSKIPNIEYSNSITDKELSIYLATPFNIKRNLSKFLIFKRENTFYLASVFHHLVFDGFSIIVFESELKKALNKVKLDIDNTYLYSSAFTFKVKDESIYKDAEVFFESQLCDIDDIPTLIEDTDGTAGRYFQKLDANKDTVAKYLKENSISASAFMSCAFAYTISRFTGFDKAIINIIENGRDRYKNSQSAIGMFVNTLPVVFDCANKPISDFIKKESEKIYKTLSYNFYGFRLLAKKYNIDSSVMFQFDPDMNLDISSLDKDFKITQFDKKDTIADLNVNVIEIKGTYKISITHSKKYSHKTAKALCDTFNRVVNGILTCKKFSDINYTSDEDISYLNKLNATDKELKYKDILEAFKESIEKYPDNKLVTYEDISYTYSEGAKVISAIADKLREKSIQARSNVAILVQRSHWYQLCALGVLTNGCAYVPIDDTYPNERIAFMLKDTSVSAVLVTNETVERAKEIFKEYSIQTKLINVDKIDYSIVSDKYTYTQADAYDTACILYTSGTTGKPKGSLITRKAVINVIQWYNHLVNFTENDTFCMYCSFGFDGNVLALFCVIYNGGCVDILPESKKLNIYKIALHFNIHKITHSKIPAAIIRIINHNDIKFKFLKTFLAGGEKLSYVKKTSYKLFDCYGPTECLVDITAVDNSDKIDVSSVGNILSNCKIYILDSNLSRVPCGAIGELFISGYQLASGYLNREKETKEAFLDNPFDANKLGYEKMYKTGDMVRILPDGTLGFIGRKDSQVKIRGNRVELGEIETCIRQLDYIKDCTVVAISNNNTKELVAYVVLNKDIADNEEVTVEQVKKHILNSKPSYMVPSFVKIIDKIPLNVNGKVDKRALPTNDLCNLKVKYISPSNQTQKNICRVIEEVLNIKKCGINNNFFDLGLDSLSIVKVLFKLEKYNYKIVYQDLFKYTTPLKLANHIDNLKTSTMLFLDNYDYTKINKLLKYNCMNNVDNFKKIDVRNIIITGATGFLGIHVLKQFLETKKGIAYCLVRKGKYKSSKQRLSNMLIYYFGSVMSINFIKEKYINRIECIDGDITNLEELMKLKDLNANIVINCAACVKHFVNDDILDRVNVDGVKNLIEVCLAGKKRLIQISTTSVGGKLNKNIKHKKLKENLLHFGQIIDNDYVRTKFLAERAILEARVERGLNGIIIRVGKLLSRHLDGEFQINFATNGFFRRLNSFNQIGVFPITAMHSPVEFSPIDSTANAILKLASIEGKFSIFHADNHHLIYMSDVIYAMKHYGFQIDIVSEERFTKIIKKIKNNNKINEAILGLIAYDNRNKESLILTQTDNRFTVEILYRLGYLWPIIDNKYLYNAISILDNYGFFEKGDFTDNAKE